MNCILRKESTMKQIPPCLKCGRSVDLLKCATCDELKKYRQQRR